LAEVLTGISTPLVFLVPLFISEGYFSNEVVPRELGFSIDNTGALSRVQRRGEQTLVYCQPIGTHPGMAELLLVRAREVVQQFPFPRAPEAKDITLFIAGHGTEQNENSRVAIERQVELLRTKNLYAGVHGVFLDELPQIPECYQLAQTRHMVVVPFFISEGMHVREDIPILLGEPKRVVEQRIHSGQPAWRNPSEKHGKLVWYAAAVGTTPLLADIILDRVREAAVWVASGV